MLSRYLTYSFLFHTGFIFYLVFANVFPRPSKNYYAVDFFGGLPAGSFGDELKTAPAKTEAVKEMIVNPKEDILLKNKKPSKKVKEVISEIPSVPSMPSPKVLKGEDVPSEVPAAPGSGIGIAFGGGRGSGSGGGNFPYTWYVSSLQKSLDKNWNVRQGFSNRVYAQVAFTIQKNGSLAKIEIEESSKNDVFDGAALRAVETSNPMPPLPAGFQESELRVHVRFTVKKY